MRQEIYLIGIGVGTLDTMTVQAQKLILKADLIIGAKRMLAVIEDYVQAERIMCYKADEIKEHIIKRPHVGVCCILLSGDVGFYSGAKKLLSVLDGYQVTLIPGISSLVYFCAKCKVSWQDMCLISLHGIAEPLQVNVIDRIIHNKYCFLLLSAESDLTSMVSKLRYYQMQDVILHIGERLGYEDEKIESVNVEEYEDNGRSNLLVVIVDNSKTETYRYREIEDEDFLRSKVPMTKAEVRDVCISKLGLTNSSVLYDIGAGTGSISIQAALNVPDCRIYAIEQKEEACELIEENKKRFVTDFVQVIHGKAPEKIQGLKTPTHAFIGGSGGNMVEILNELRKQNSKIRIVITAVTLETQAQVLDYINKQEIKDAQIVQMMVAKAQVIGEYHFMNGQNPIQIISFGGM